MRKSRILHHFPWAVQFPILMRRHSIFWHSWHLLFKRVTMQIKSLDMSQTRILNIKILYFESTVLANFIENPFLFFTCTLIENHHSLFWLWYKKSLRIYCATWRDNFHGPHLKFISYQRDFSSITSIYM